MFLLFKLCARNSLSLDSTRCRTAKKSNFEANKLKNSINIKREILIQLPMWFRLSNVELHWKELIFRLEMASNTFVPSFKKIYFSGSKLKRCDECLSLF